MFVLLLVEKFMLVLFLPLILRLACVRQNIEGCACMLRNSDAMAVFPARYRGAGYYTRHLYFSNSWELLFPEFEIGMFLFVVIGIEQTISSPTEISQECRLIINNYFENDVEYDGYTIPCTTRMPCFPPSSPHHTHTRFLFQGVIYPN